MSRALLGIIVSGHGHRLNAALLQSQCLDDVRHIGGFDPVAGFPPAGLSLAVLWSWLVVLDACSVSSLL